MNRRSLIQLTGHSSAMALLSGCDPFISHRSFNCRVTVEANTSSGKATGSSVIQIIAEQGVIAIGDSGVQAGVGLAGQAIVVELANGPLFVLLSKQTGYDSIAASIVDALAPIPDVDKYSYYSRAKQLSSAEDSGLKAELPSFLWPKMVRFRNLNDPKSIELVQSGSGVSHIWLEPTAAPLTTGIEKHFPPWFMDYYQRKATLDGRTSIGVFSNALSANMSPGSFTGGLPI